MNQKGGRQEPSAFSFGGTGIGEVGHDRFQQGRASQSIGEAIRYWHNLPSGDFERIDVDIEILDDAFYVTPTQFKLVGKSKPVSIGGVFRPLSFTHEYVSSLWLRQLHEVRKGRRPSGTTACIPISPAAHST